MRFCRSDCTATKEFECVFTNPSYFNDAQYAKLMEFRYVWFQGSIRELSEFCPRQRRTLIILGATWLLV